MKVLIPRRKIAKNCNFACETLKQCLVNDVKNLKFYHKIYYDLVFFLFIEEKSINHVRQTF